MFKIRNFIFILLAYTFSACNVLQRGGQTSTSVQKKALSEKEQVAFTRLFFNANKEKMLGNYDNAASIFSQCIRKDPTSAVAMYELANIYIQTEKYEEALFFARKATVLEPENLWYQLSLADAYKKTKKFNKAADVYKQIVKVYPVRIDIYYEWATALLYMGKYSEAIDVYDKVEKIIGVFEETSFQKERIYIKLNKIDKAINELEKLIKEYPLETKYYGDLGDLYQANNMNEKALEIYLQLLKIDPENPFVHLSLADHYRSIDEKDKSFNELKMAFTKPTLDIDTKVNILFKYFSLTRIYPRLSVTDAPTKQIEDSTSGGYEQSLTLCKILVETHPDDAKSHSIYGDFLYWNKQLEDARDQFRLAVDLEKDKFVIWRHLLGIESELQDYESMLKESKEAIELFPNQAILYLFNGIAYVRLKKYQEALEVLNSGIEIIADDKLLLVDFYSTLGDTYHSNKEMKASDEAYEKALEIDSNNIYVLNNYSYYLSMRREELERARKMSEKANEIEPGSASFQDTYGWILYCLGDYSEAKVWIEKSLENGGDKKSIILEHYGDILFKLGEIEKALENWKKAKSKGEGSDLLDKKIADKQLYE
ncbi:MAG: tetratricopeptide repeat protein [Bacteroidota bacterium]